MQALLKTMHHINGTLDTRIFTCPAVVSVALCKPFMIY